MYEIANFSASFSLEPALERRRSIVALEQALLSMEQAELGLEHYFAHGMYARSLSIPKNCVLTGAIHTQEHISILLKGEMSIATDDGPQRLMAPCVMVCKPGTKRAGFAHEDSIWLTVEATDHTDVDSAQAVLVTNDYESWLKELECHPLLPPQ